MAPVHSIEGFEGSVVLADVVGESLRTRHDPHKLALALMAIADSRSGEVEKALS